MSNNTFTANEKIEYALKTALLITTSNPYMPSNQELLAPPRVFPSNVNSKDLISAGEGDIGSDGNYVAGHAEAGVKADLNIPWNTVKQYRIIDPETGKTSGKTIATLFVTNSLTAGPNAASSTYITASGGTFDKNKFYDKWYYRYYYPGSGTDGEKWDSANENYPGLSLAYNSVGDSVVVASGSANEVPHLKVYLQVQTKMIPGSNTGAKRGQYSDTTEDAISYFNPLMKNMCGPETLAQAAVHTCQGTSYGTTGTGRDIKPIGYAVNEWYVQPTAGMLSFYALNKSGQGIMASPTFPADSPFISFVRYTGDTGFATSSGGGGGGGATAPNIVISYNTDTSIVAGHIGSSGCWRRFGVSEGGTTGGLEVIITPTSLTSKIRLSMALCYGISTGGKTTWLVRIIRTINGVSEVILSDNIDNPADNTTYLSVANKATFILSHAEHTSWADTSSYEDIDEPNTLLPVTYHIQTGAYASDHARDIRWNKSYAGGAVDASELKSTLIAEELTGSGGGGATTLNDLTDVSTAGATDGQAIVYNGSSWAPGSVAAGGGGSGGTQAKDGQVLETLAGRCDGRSITVSSGTYTLENVDDILDINATYQYLTGSKISYNPPPGTKQVKYTFNYYWRFGPDNSPHDIQSIFNIKCFLDGSEVTWFTGTRMTGQYNGWYHEESIIFDIGGSDDIANGKLLSWNTLKEIKLMVSEGTTAYEAVFHEAWPQGEHSQRLHMNPSLEIVAIGRGKSAIPIVGTNMSYVNFQDFVSIVVGNTAHTEIEGLRLMIQLLN